MGQFENLSPRSIYFEQCLENLVKVGLAVQMRILMVLDGIFTTFIRTLAVISLILKIIF